MRFLFLFFITSLLISTNTSYADDVSDNSYTFFSNTTIHSTVKDPDTPFFKRVLDALTFRKAREKNEKGRVKKIVEDILKDSIYAKNISLQNLNKELLDSINKQSEKIKTALEYAMLKIKDTINNLKTDYNKQIRDLKNADSASKASVDARINKLVAQLEIIVDSTIEIDDSKYKKIAAVRKIIDASYNAMPQKIVLNDSITKVFKVELATKKMVFAYLSLEEAAFEKNNFKLVNTILLKDDDNVFCTNPNNASEKLEEKIKKIKSIVTDAHIFGCTVNLVINLDDKYTSNKKKDIQTYILQWLNLTNADGINIKFNVLALNDKLTSEIKEMSETLKAANNYAFVLTTPQASDNNDEYKKYKKYLKDFQTYVDNFIIDFSDTTKEKQTISSQFFNKNVLIYLSKQIPKDKLIIYLPLQAMLNDSIETLTEKYDEIITNANGGVAIDFLSLYSDKYEDVVNKFQGNLLDPLIDKFIKFDTVDIGYEKDTLNIEKNTTTFWGKIGSELNLYKQWFDAPYEFDSTKLCNGKFGAPNKQIPSSARYSGTIVKWLLIILTILLFYFIIQK